MDEKNKSILANYIEIREIVIKLEKKMDLFNKSNSNSNLNKKFGSNGLFFYANNIPNSSNANTISKTNYESSNYSKTLNNSLDEKYFQEKSVSSYSYQNPFDLMENLKSVNKYYIIK